MVHDWVVVGGGIHGTHIALRIRDRASDPSLSVRIVDPNPSLLQQWQNRTTATRMSFLRSPAVHNLGIDPFCLKKFAGKKKYGFKRFRKPYDRPALELFNRHCLSQISEYSLEQCHIQDSVENISLSSGLVSLKTFGGRVLSAKKVVLALGPSEHLQVPGWAKETGNRVRHIFSPDFDWKDIEKGRSVAIIGGGISAAQAAMHAESSGLRVHLVCRHAIRQHQFDSDPGWLGPKFMTNFTRETDLGQRRKWIRESRHTGSIPPEIGANLEARIRLKRIHLHQSEVGQCRKEQNGVRLELDSKKTIEVDRVILATGMKPERPGGNLIDKLIQEYHLPVSECGFPVVDKALRWHPSIHVSGALAELEIGPVAKNIAGARQAADRILA